MELNANRVGGEGAPRRPRGDRDRRGHEIVATADRADVVLADAVDVEAGDAAVVTLGSADLGQAGILPRDASPVQIDAALRAAAGLIVRGAMPAQPAFGA
jgi:hypothetical protein